MEVDDTYIGRLVGKAGSILADIMATTKASIKISQKGEFVAGTNYRIVTVTGDFIACCCPNLTVLHEVTSTVCLRMWSQVTLRMLR
jgi:hypothetical protein